MKTGLVLAGGGAKGAYQIGAWQALREHGIEFDTIAGTSIGALNAALIASGDFDKARSFWRSLSTLQLARTQPLLLVGLVLRLFSTLTPHSRLSKIHSAESLRQLIKYEVIAIVVLAFLVTLAAVFLSAPSAVIIPVGVSALGFLAVMMLLPDVAELVNGSLISRQVLSRLLDESVNWEKIAAGRPTVFVTIARIARRRHERRRTATIPDYATLSTLATSVARDCVAASMALPFGVFPRIEILGKRYMDGGVADNIPIYPVILHQCEIIYVVHLSPKPCYSDLDLRSDEQLERAMHMIDFRRQSTGAPGLYVRNWFQTRLQIGLQLRNLLLSPDEILAQMEEGFNRPGDGNVKIVHIVPQKRLGWGLLGTLLFSHAKTERLMARGYEDAKATLAGLRPLPQSPLDWRETRERRATRSVILVLMIKVLMIVGLLLLTRYLKSR